MIPAAQPGVSLLVSSPSPLITMISKRAFDPATGAPLSEEKLYPNTYRYGVRSPIHHPQSCWIRHRDEALTNGELQSSMEGLLGYFKRVHRACRAPEPSLDSAAALALKRLKAAEADAADGGSDTQPREYIDVFVWYALAERLSRKGHWVSWMIDFAQPRCPHCQSVVRFEQGARLIAKCGSSDTCGMVHDDILDLVLRIYNTAFARVDGRIEELSLIR